MEVTNAEPQVQTELPIEAAPQPPAVPMPPVDGAETEMPSEPVAPDAPTEPVEEEKLAIEEPVLPEDRTAFNCKVCNGEGLIGDPAGQHEFCIACNGTGKV